jgi:predicted solute-binding protein
MGSHGEKAIRRLFEMAREKKLVPDFELKIAS